MSSAPAIPFASDRNSRLHWWLTIYGAVSLLALAGMGLFAYWSLDRLEKICDADMAEVRHAASDAGDTALTDLGERLVFHEAEDTVAWIDDYFTDHPSLNSEQMQASSDFRSLAVQPVGLTGFTGVIDAGSGTVLVDARRDLENRSLNSFAARLPEFTRILTAALGGKRASGYYDWVDPDGKVRRKFMWILPVKSRAADGRALSVISSAYVDEFTGPIQKLHAHLDSDLVRQFAFLRHSEVETFAILMLAILAIQGATGGLIGFIFWQLLRSRKQLRDSNAGLAIAKQAEEAKSAQLLTTLKELDAARENLERDHRTTELLVSSIGSVLIGLDNQIHLTQWNARAEQVFGVNPERILHGPFEACGIRWNWVVIREHIAACLREGTTVRLDDFAYERPEGGTGLLTLSINPIVARDGTRQGLVIVGEETTAHRMMERQLAQAQKLESIGQLAAGIAHEINTPIQYVGDNTRFIQDAFKEMSAALERVRQALVAGKDGESSAVIPIMEEALGKLDLEFLQEEVPQAIEQTLEGVGRVSNIVRAMKDFSHPDSGRKTMTDLNRAIESTITVSRNEWKYVAEMKTDLDPNLPHIACLSGELNQVILNMIVNAAHAIIDRVGPEWSKGRGEIHIATRSVDEGVEIDIGDTGTGIPSAIRTKIFDPFFTTKAVGRGTGQGLAIAHNVVVKRHGGSITFQSQEGEGTTFTIHLPLQSA